jgi:hypothetical protein
LNALLILRGNAITFSAERVDRVVLCQVQPPSDSGALGEARPFSALASGILNQGARIGRFFGNGTALLADGSLAWADACAFGARFRIA